MPECIICRKTGSKLVKCRDLKSWSSLYDSALAKKEERILSLSSRDTFPTVNIEYHRDCRSLFTHKKSVASPIDLTTLKTPLPKRLTRSEVDVAKTDILPKQCIFCNKDKYKPRERTREKLRSVEELRADEKVRESALIHIDTNSFYKDAAEKILLIHSKDLISSEAKYHSSCYKLFVKTFYKNNITSKTSRSIQSSSTVSSSMLEERTLGYDFRTRNDQDNDNMISSTLSQSLEELNCPDFTNINDEEVAIHKQSQKTNNSMHEENSTVDLDLIFESVNEFCESLIKNPDVVRFKVVRTIVNDEAEKLNIKLNPSYQKNLLRKVSTAFPSINFIHREHNCVLMYP